MAEHMIETRILLRYDTLTNWLSSTVILKKGEMAVAAATYDYTIEGTNYRPSNTPPAIGLKVGDGVHYFDELPWVQAVASDVYAWAKAATKPTYSATEISGLAEFIANQGGGGGGSGGTTSSAYRIIYDTINSKYILQTYDETNQEWVNTTSEINLSDILTRINNIERWANGARSNLGNIELPITEYIYEEVLNYLNQLDYNDQAQPHQFVTAVSENNGKISVTRSTISMSDITGVLSTSQGGTGITRVEDDELLVGSLEGNLQVRRFVSHIEETDRNVFATTGAIIDYVTDQTAGLTGAMHYIGEATVEITNGSNINPRITGYNFSKAEPGDVIIFNSGEFVWSGAAWRLIGEEGSYAIKGSITNSDIAPEANIDQSKIANLTDDLDRKVDKVEGKGLSTNDYTNEEKSKLNGIEDNAQRNIIEHIYVNGTEAIPTTIDGNENSLSLRVSALTPEEEAKIAGIEANAQVNAIEHIFLNEEELQIKTVKTLPKSVNIAINEFTDAEKEKLETIEAYATPNTIEKIFFNETQFTPNSEKEVHVTIDPATLDLSVIEGAQIPNGSQAEDITITNKKLQLARIAATGDVSDLNQMADTYIILNCGSSTEVI